MVNTSQQTGGSVATALLSTLFASASRDYASAQPRHTDLVAAAAVHGYYTERWDGRWRLEVREGAFADADHGGRSVVFEVVPTKAFGHAKGDAFGQTTYRF